MFLSISSPLGFMHTTALGRDWQREGFTKAYGQNPGDRQATECTQQVLSCEAEKANLCVHFGLSQLLIYMNLKMLLCQISTFTVLPWKPSFLACRKVWPGGCSSLGDWTQRSSRYQRVEHRTEIVCAEESPRPSLVAVKTGNLLFPKKLSPPKPNY